MLALGFSSGLPFLLIFSTQSAWLREAGVSRSAIGLMSYAALAFTFKFAWAPFIDEYDPPLVGRWLGRRRGWMLIAQLGVAAGLSGLAFGAPAESLGWSFAFAFLTAFAAASQDVTIDGWRIDAAPIERQGMMSAVYQLGYRLAMLCAGAGALYIADFASWRAAYLAMAGLMLVGIGGCLLSPRLDTAAGSAGESRRFLRRLVRRAARRSFSPLRPSADRDPHAGGDLSPARFRLRRDGEPALYRPRLHQVRHRHRLKALRRLDRHCRRVRRRRRGGAARAHALAHPRRLRRLVVAPDARFARGARREPAAADPLRSAPRASPRASPARR